MKQLFKKLAKNQAFVAYHNRSDHLGNLSLNEEVLMIASSYQKNKKRILIVKNNLYTAQNLYERLAPLLQEDVLLFGVEGSLRVASIAASPELLAKQIETLYTLQNKDTYVCITHAEGYTKFLADPEVFSQYSISISVNDTYDFDAMKQHLYKAGYNKTSYVDQPLCYASRGGIIDVFSINYEYPLRIEFFDNEIDSIRFYDIETKRTIQTLQEATIIPASDFLLSETQKAYLQNVLQEKIEENIHPELKDKLGKELEYIQNEIKEPVLNKYYALLLQQFSVVDYIQSKDIIISTMEEVENSFKHTMRENISYIQELESMNHSIALYNSANDIHKYEKDIMHVHRFVHERHPIFSNIESIEQSELSIEQKLKEFIHQAKDYAIYMDISVMQKEKIKNILYNMNLSYDEVLHLEQGIHLVEVGLVEGFKATDEKILWLSEKDIFNVDQRKRKENNKFKEAEVLHDYLELHNGDYIVHKLYGVGQYIGIITKEKEGIRKDYLRIVYKGNDELLIPLEQFKLIRKFVSKEGAVPKLHKLGSGEWEKTRAKVSANVKELAERLVKLYSLREQNIGYAFSKDNTFVNQFEDDFSYALTHDQKQATQEIKTDMEKAVPMDRLLIGDVGFGKTEVAFRAAFKAVLDNKQVAFLCPTTILSQQHFKTALKRYMNFPVTIKIVNRFISTKEFSEIKRDLKEGKIDILIGTHRLFSKQLEFKDLGLLIIDEEQRFGVEHKEKIKELKTSVDVLSLSATPIPRTLQMSLVGIRQLSQLNTPPSNRMSIQTYVIEKNETLITEVIERELSRNGQVFYLYNNVKEIYNVARKLQKKCKGLKVGIAHGQMGKEEIEDVMMKFTQKEYQVLVCTTIIETGIDIPNANTILIEDADRFGLSQLYQIKGRVGRSDRLAYAYLMYSPQKQLSEIAIKRLQSMKEFAKLGSGYKIALRDLSIRGAGDMLGPKQAGFIDTVGMDMYIEMLNEAIQESKGIKLEQTEELLKADVKVDAYIPESFEDQDYEKITLYQKLEAMETKQDLLAMQEEIVDTHGKLPRAVELLFEKKQLDIFLNEKNIEQFSQTKTGVKVEFSEYFSQQVDGVALFERVTTLSVDIKVSYQNNRISAFIPKSRTYLKLIIQLISECEKLI